MTVAELIEKLQEMPGELEVRIFADISDMEIVSVDCEEGDGGDVVLLVAADA